MKKKTDRRRHAEHGQQRHQHALLAARGAAPEAPRVHLLGGYLRRQRPRRALDDDQAHRGISPQFPACGRDPFDPPTPPWRRLAVRAGAILLAYESSRSGRVTGDVATAIGAARSSAPVTAPRERPAHRAPPTSAGVPQHGAGATSATHQHARNGQGEPPGEHDRRHRFLPGHRRRAGQPDRRGSARGRRRSPTSTRRSSGSPASPRPKARPTGYHLVRRDGTVLDARRSLAAQRILDGDLLSLRPFAESLPPAVFDDVSDAVASAVTPRPPPLERRPDARRRTHRRRACCW